MKFITISILLLSENIQLSKAVANTCNIKCKEEVIQKLKSAYDLTSSNTNIKQFTKMHIFLLRTDQKGAKNHEADYASPYWELLKLAEGDTLIEYLKLMEEDLIEFEDDPEYYKVIEKIYKSMADLEGKGGNWISPDSRDGLGKVIGKFAGTSFGWAIGAFSKFYIEPITNIIFSLQQADVLQDAYKFFGVKATASNLEINLIYKKKAIAVHPSRGGRAEDFFELEYYFEIIKADRDKFKY